MLRRILKSWKFWLILVAAAAALAFFYLPEKYLGFETDEGVNQNPIDYVTNRIKSLVSYVQDISGDGSISDNSKLSESVEAVIGQGCLTVFPTNVESIEELDSLVNQHLDILLAGIAGEDSLQDYEAFILPNSDQPECMAVLYEDSDSKDKFLIYETDEGIVKVPFTPPPSP